MKIFCIVNISKLNIWLVICIAENFIWTTLKMIFSIFRFFAPSKYCPNHTSMESYLFSWCINLNLTKLTLKTGFVLLFEVVYCVCSALLLIIGSGWQALLNRCESARSPLISSSAESEQQLTDQRRHTLTLLQAQHGTLPKTEAELLQDNQRVSLQLQQTQKQVEVWRERNTHYSFWVHPIVRDLIHAFLDFVICDTGAQKQS